MYHVINAFLSCSISIIGVILFGRIVLNNKIKISTAKFILLFLASAIIYTYDFLFFAEVPKTITMLLIDVLIYKILFYDSYPKSIMLSVLYIIVLIISDTLNLFIYTKIFGISKNYFYANMAGNVLGNLTVLILFALITYLLRKQIKKIVDYKLETNIKIIVFSILTFLSLIIFIYMFSNAFQKGNSIIEYLIVITVLIVILIDLLIQTYNNNVLSEKYDKILGFMTTYEEEVEKQRVLRHETKNEFLNIKGQILDKTPKEKTIEYIDRILNDKSKIKYEEYAKFQYLPPNGIKGLCYLKVQEAQTKGIIVGINISSRITKSNVYKINMKEQRDFARIIGVFLDNAIEASVESKDKQLGIEAYTKDNEFQMIISNTYNNEVDKAKIGQERFSTKGNNRGHGLLLVKNLVKNNDIFEINTEVNDKLYIQYIKIKKSI